MKQAPRSDRLRATGRRKGWPAPGLSRLGGRVGPLMLAVAVTVPAASCGEDGSDPQEPGSGVGDPVLREVVSGLEQPVFLTAPEGDDRLFVVEQPGRIRVIRNGEVLATPFLDITARVGFGGERGLLSMAFHPEYPSDPRFFVNYTDGSGATVVASYTVSGDPARAEPTSAATLLRISQPFPNHNGGQLRFGPDGMLFIGMGDGGAAGDPGNRAQDGGTLLGKLLRIDVDSGDGFGIPPDNPYVGEEGVRDEIWARGLRNPWRFSFDTVEAVLYVADVGQNEFEEVNAVPAEAGGLNYGWNDMEGRVCFLPGCSPTGLTLPVLVYDHGQGCSVTGGSVYRGSALPELAGHYFYADFCAGWIRSFRLAGQEATDRREWSFGDVGMVSSFGEDARGELYVLTIGGGVFKLEPGA